MGYDLRFDDGKIDKDQHVKDICTAVENTLLADRLANGQAIYSVAIEYTIDRKFGRLDWETEGFIKWLLQQSDPRARQVLVHVSADQIERHYFLQHHLASSEKTHSALVALLSRLI